MSVMDREAVDREGGGMGIPTVVGVVRNWDCG